MSTTERAKQRRLHRFTIAQYEKMGEAGILSKADRVVLLDGLVVKKMTKGPAHVTATLWVLKVLGAVLPAGWHVRGECPVVLPRPEDRPSEPEPDAAVVRGNIDDYKRRHPGPGDVALVVEVADNSLEDDRKALARYARHRIPCVWIVNLRDTTVEVYDDPDPGGLGYTKRDIKDLDNELTVSLPAREGGKVDVAGPVSLNDLFR